MAKNMRMMCLLLLLVIAVAPTIKSDINFYRGRSLVVAPIVASFGIDPLKNDSYAKSYSILRRGMVATSNDQLDLPKMPPTALEDKVWRNMFNEKNNINTKSVLRRQIEVTSNDQLDLLTNPTIALKENVWKNTFNQKNNIEVRPISRKQIEATSNDQLDLFNLPAIALEGVSEKPFDNTDNIETKSVLRRESDVPFTNQLDLLKIPTIALEEKVWKKPFNEKNNVVKKMIFEKKSTYCTVDFTDHRPLFKTVPYMQTIYFVTPTYPRPEQIPELIQLSHTLMHVPKIFWIVADDNTVCSQEVSMILKRSQLPFAHISSPKPEVHSDNERGNENFPRGLATRRAALKFIYKYLNDGVVYFGDDDNTYDLQVFEEIRKTKKISMLPVGLIGSYGISSPLVLNGKVIGFFDSWFGGKSFAIDMAGFAININHLKKYTTMKYEVGSMGNNFLIAAGFEVNDIEPLANNCTEILVWHTQSIKSPIRNLKFNMDRVYEFKYDNLAQLLRQLVKRNVIRTDPDRGAVPKVIKYNKFMMMMRIPLKLF